MGRKRNREQTILLAINAIQVATESLEGSGGTALSVTILRLRRLLKVIGRNRIGMLSFTSVAITSLVERATPSTTTATTTCAETNQFCCWSIGDLVSCVFSR